MAQAKVTKFVTEQLIQRRNEIIQTIAHSAIDMSPVDTGAYVESMSVTQTRGSGRSRSSAGKPRKQNPEEKKAIARGQVDSDIAAIPDGAENIYINNHAPHASYVEGKYGIFALARQMMRGGRRR